MADAETLNQPDTSEPTGWTMHLPGPDGTPRAGGHITQRDYEDMLQDPSVAARLERVQQIAERRRQGGEGLLSRG